MRLSYTSDYPHSEGYYALDGQTITLTCQFDVTSQTVTWTAGGTSIYNYFNGDGFKANTVYKNRIQDYHVTEKEHQLVFLVSKSVDEGQKFKCQVRIGALVFETGEIQLEGIIGE